MHAHKHVKFGLTKEQAPVSTVTYLLMYTINHEFSVRSQGGCDSEVLIPFLCLPVSFLYAISFFILFSGTLC